MSFDDISVTIVFFTIYIAIGAFVFIITKDKFTKKKNKN